MNHVILNNFSAQVDKPSTPENANTKESKTIPDQTLSLKELLQRHARGQNITIFQPEYQAHHEYDEFTANLRNMPLLDRLDFARQVKEDANATIKDLEAKKKIKDAEQKAKDEADKAAYKAYVKSLNPDGEERTTVKTPLRTEGKK